MDGFDGPDLVLGSIYGVRHFGWDGRLRAVTHSYTWSPGENKGECLATRRTPKSWRRAKWCVEVHGEDHNEEKMKAVSAWLGVAPLELEIACMEVDEWEDSHTAGAPDCQCGFWAYYDGAQGSPYANWNRIAGVIEGYGRTTVGTKGFRCEKAKIVALMVPLPEKPKEPEPEPEPLDQKAFFAAERRKYQLWSLLVVTLPWTLRNLWDIRRSSRMHGPGECTDTFSHGSTGGLGDYLWCTRELRRYSKRDRLIVAEQNRRQPKRRDPWHSIFLSPWAQMQDSVRVEEVAAWYPDVPIFHSMEEMLREFPTEKPDFTEEVA